MIRLHRIVALAMLAFGLASWAEAPSTQAGPALQEDSTAVNGTETVEETAEEPGEDIGEDIGEEKVMEPAEPHGNGILTPPSSAPVAASTPLAAPADASAYDASGTVQRHKLLFIQSTDNWFRTGAVLTYGGLAFLLVSPFLPSDKGIDLSQLGMLAYVVGEPMMGVSAGTLNQAALQVPGYRDPGGGWGYYAAGWGLKTVGAAWTLYILLSHLEVGFVGPVPIPYSDVESRDLALPMTLVAAGLVSEGISLYKFHARRSAALEAVRIGMTLAPAHQQDGGGGLRAGARVTLAF